MKLRVQSSLSVANRSYNLRVLVFGLDLDDAPAFFG